MQFISLNNQKLISYLQSTIEFLYSDQSKKIISRTLPQKDSLLPDLDPCSDEYLLKAMEHKIPEYGYPRAALGLGMKENNDSYLFFEPVIKKVQRIGNFLGTPTNALTMAYPDNGYIGWHHNGNAPGYNILMTYSQDGDGWFKYWDKDKKEIVTHIDKPGWSVKVGYYPSQKTETDRVYWHAAKTKKQRISLAWVLDHRDMWENMIESITEGDYDKNILKQNHMNV